MMYSHATLLIYLIAFCFDNFFPRDLAECGSRTILGTGALKAMYGVVILLLGKHLQHMVMTLFYRKLAAYVHKADD